MNILILSCGSRNKIVEYFKREIGNNGKVIATDMSELAPAIYEADKFYIVPRIDDPKYIDTILNICMKEKIDGVLSLIDPELSLLAENVDRFEAINAKLVLSDYSLVEKCLDKMAFMAMLQAKGYKTIKSFDSLEAFKKAKNIGDIDFPVFVKPIKGSASLNIHKVKNQEELDVVFNSTPNLMIQEYIDGTEYGVDVYIDLIDHEVKNIFIKEKIKMRAGETDKSKSVNDKDFLAFVKSFVLDFGFSGVVDIDIFVRSNEIFISEVNPRFGGGYPHAYETGVNIPRNILANLNNESPESSIGNYKSGTYMMKYNELKIIN